MIIEDRGGEQNPMRNGIGAFGTEANAHFFVSNMMNIFQTNEKLNIGKNKSKI